MHRRPISLIRPSQWVVSWGPGSILETGRGSGVVPHPTSLLEKIEERYEIRDTVASEVLKREVEQILGSEVGEVRIYTLPTNAEELLPETEVLYWLKPFPSWRLCQEREKHKNKHSILFQGSRCPECGSEDQEQIRFVRACCRGHLDDVDWHHLLHGGVYCGQHYFEWMGGGGLRETKIRCPNCKREINLGQAWNREWPCSGRLPERDQSESCSSPSFIVLRQASNLRIPYVITLFPVAPLYTELHQHLGDRAIRLLVEGIQDMPDFWERLERVLRQAHDRGQLDSQTVEEILKAGKGRVQRAMRDLEEVPRTLGEVLQREFRTFVEGSREGIPPQYDRGGSKPLIEVRPQDVRRAGKFKVIPVHHLSTIVVQVGYWRDVRPVRSRSVTSEQPHLVPVGTPRGWTLWFPGVRLHGEGIFLMLDEGEEPLLPKGESAGRWMDAWRQGGRGYPRFVFRCDRREELHPVFVWWHALSHLLIRAISKVAGHPLASIRERVYWEQAGSECRGGVLLYSVQPGAGGTMGGLLSLVSRFDGLLREVQEMAGRCSQDPLCWEQEFRPGGYAGASCYACLQLPETSCEHRNMWLDRRVLAENFPGD